MHDIDTSDSPTGQDQIDRASVARVVVKVDLEDVRLVWARSGLNVEPERLPADWATRTFLGFDVHAHQWNAERDQFSVRALFVAAHNLDWTDEQVSKAEAPEVDADNPPDVDIAVLFELTYSIADSSDISDRDVEHFAAFNSTFNAWPYWRELAQTVTNRMRIPTLLIPVLRLPSVRIPAEPQGEDVVPESGDSPEALDGSEA